MGLDIGKLVGKAARWITRQAEEEAEKEIEKDLGTQPGQPGQPGAPSPNPGMTPQGPTSPYPRPRDYPPPNGPPRGT